MTSALERGPQKQTKGTKTADFGTWQGGRPKIRIFCGSHIWKPPNTVRAWTLTTGSVCSWSIFLAGFPFPEKVFWLYFDVLSFWFHPSRTHLRVNNLTSYQNLTENSDLSLGGHTNNISIFCLQSCVMLYSADRIYGHGKWSIQLYGQSSCGPNWGPTYWKCLDILSIFVGLNQPYPDRGSKQSCLLQSRLLQFDVTRAGGLLL